MTSHPVPAARPKPKRVMLFTNPRTASNLFAIMMSKQKDLVHAGYFHFPAGRAIREHLQQHSIDQIAPDQLKICQQLYQDCFSNMVEAVENIEAQVTLVNSS